MNKDMNGVSAPPPQSPRFSNTALATVTKDKPPASWLSVSESSLVHQSTNKAAVCLHKVQRWWSILRERLEDFPLSQTQKTRGEVSAVE